MKIIKKIFYHLYKFFFPLIKLLIYPGSKIHSYISPFVKLGKKVEIFKNCKIKEYVKINDFTFINCNTRIDLWTESIGKFCSISYNVIIGPGPHPIEYISTSPALYSKARGLVKKDLFNINNKKKVIIENDVWIGANAIIMPGVSIGTGAIIGAGSIVTKDVPPYAIVVGIPAKVLKYRFDKKTIKSLLASKWWDKDIKILIKNSYLINKPMEFIKAINH